MASPELSSRDAAALRVRRASRAAIAGSALLATVFTAVAAGSTHAKRIVRAAVHPRARAAVLPPVRVTAPPPLPPGESAPAPPPALPSPSAAPPVAVSGGS